MLYALYYFLSIVIVIFIHELGHMLVALAVGIKVNIFSLGFGKPYLEKEMWGIKFRLTPWLIGGYAEMEGEGKGNEWIDNAYHKKLGVVLAGVAMNIVLASICYLVMYRSIFIGMFVDWIAIKAIFTKNWADMMWYIQFIEAYPFLAQLSLLNLFAFATNLMPIPALDGGFVWIFWTEKLFKTKKSYVKFLNIFTKIFFWLLMIGQLILVYWLYIADLIK